MAEKMFSVTMADCDFETFPAGGKGGQHQNKASTGVRIRHRASGAVGVARDSRSQHQNKRQAFIRMSQSDEFKRWLTKATMEHGRNLEREVRDDVRPENLRVETMRDGEWRL